MFKPILLLLQGDWAWPGYRMVNATRMGHPVGTFSAGRRRYWEHTTNLRLSASKISNRAHLRPTSARQRNTSRRDRVKLTNNPAMAPAAMAITGCLAAMGRKVTSTA
jgi:hypothetical protein